MTLPANAPNTGVLILSEWRIRPTISGTADNARKASGHNRDENPAKERLGQYCVFSAPRHDKHNNATPANTGRNNIDMKRPAVLAAVAAGSDLRKASGKKNAAAIPQIGF